MRHVLINKDTLYDIADAIRAKKQTEDTYKPSEMGPAVEAISSGVLIDKTITQNGTYAASSDSADGYSSAQVNVGNNTIEKQVTANGTYAASSDNVSGYSKVTVNVPAIITPFDTYEFNIPNDINYQDATGTVARTLATINLTQTTLNKIAEYSSVTTATNPFAVAGCARILFSVRPKNNSQVVADSTYTKDLRQDTVFFVSTDGTSITWSAPTWRAIWRISTSGSLSYAGSFTTSNNTNAFSLSFGTGTIIVSTTLSSTDQMIAAGDYVIRLFDITGTVVS